MTFLLYLFSGSVEIDKKKVLGKKRSSKEISTGKVTQKPSRLYKRSPKSLLSYIDADDIRRQYANMFANTFNSSDSERFSKFLNDRCTADIRYLRTQHVPNDPTRKQRDILQQGRDAVLQLWIRRTQLMPDFTLNVVGNSHIHTYNTTKCSKIVTKVNVSGRKIYDVDITPLPNWNENEIMDISNVIQQPIMYESYGEFTLYVDENMKIYNIEVHLIGNCCVGTDSKSNILFC